MVKTWTTATVKRDSVEKMYNEIDVHHDFVPSVFNLPDHAVHDSISQLSVFLLYHAIKQIKQNES